MLLIHGIQHDDQAEISVALSR